MKVSDSLKSTFFLCLSLLNIVSSSKLDEFLKSIEEVGSNLDLVVIRPKRSHSIHELLSRFDEDADQPEDSSLEAGDAWYQSFRAMECLHGGCSKRPLRWKTRKSQPEEDYEYYKDEDDDEEQPNLQDQWDHSQNDLSHEANYKLSKIEQDATEQKLPKVAWPVRHNSKRSVDPMRAVKLKTSLRMMRNGERPTLPSSLLEEDRRQITVEDILSDSGHDENSDPWKETYEVMESRKLLSVADSDDLPMTDEKECRSKSCLHRVMDVDQFDNINQKTDLDRKLEGISFDNVEENKVSKKGVLAHLSDQLMNSEAFAKLQNFLKGKTEAGSNGTRFESSKTTTTNRSTTASPLNLVEKDKDVNIKLHMSVNATVLGDAELPEEFHKNNTITFKPGSVKSKEVEDEGLADYLDLGLDRSRRGVVFPILTSTSKRKTKDEISKSVIEATQNFPLDELITGKLTSQLVHTIFSLVKSSPNMKILWPGLMKNKVPSPKQVQNFYAIRNHDNESEMHRTEEMLRQAMETINAIIDQQVRSRSCVPLRADLRAFYNLILETQAANDQFQDRHKRETTLDDSQIRQKSRIVKKLLKDYEELPRDDQDRIANIKERLLSAAEQLKDFEESSRRRKRQIITNHLLNRTDDPVPSTADTQFTPQYLKLARTAEMISHNSLKDSDLTIDFNSI